MLRGCREEHYDDIIDLWKSLANEAYPNSRYPDLATPHPELWTTAFFEALDSIEGGGVPFALFRHIEIGLSHEYAYRTTEELKHAHSDWVESYYKAVPIPMRTGRFHFDEVVSVAISKCVRYWTESYQLIRTPQFVADIVLPIDLDTGMIIGAKNGRLPMWEA
jgi:hypothetical protein